MRRCFNTLRGKQIRVMEFFAKKEGSSRMWKKPRHYDTGGLVIFIVTSYVVARYSTCKQIRHHILRGVEWPPTPKLLGSRDGELGPSERPAALAGQRGGTNPVWRIAKLAASGDPCGCPDRQARPAGSWRRAVPETPSCKGTRGVPGRVRCHAGRRGTGRVVAANDVSVTLRWDRRIHGSHDRRKEGVCAYNCLAWRAD